jgi:hypothetical protein
MAHPTEHLLTPPGRIAPPAVRNGGRRGVFQAGQRMVRCWHLPQWRPGLDDRDDRCQDLPATGVARGTDECT